MRTVVLGTTEGKPRWNPIFEDFARHWGFTPRLCRPYRAQTKGKVETGVKYVKRNFLPGRVFRDLEDFNAQLADWLTEIADLRVHGTTHERPIDRFAGEAGVLAQAASQPSFLQAMRRERIVAEDWLVSIDANRYSVPWRLIGKTVQVVRARRSLAHPASGRARRRAPGARRTPPAARGARARPGGGGPQRPQALLRRAAGADHAIRERISCTGSRSAISPCTTRCWRPHEPRPARTPRRAPAEAAPVQEPRAARSAAAGGRRQGDGLLGLPRAGPRPRRSRPRPSKNVTMRTSMARFPFVKTLETFDFGYQPSIDRKQVQQLASCHFIEHGDNVLVLGPPGVGKTHLAVALGLKAIEPGYRVLFSTAAHLIATLAKAHAEGRLDEKLKLYTPPRLLIIDEIGYLPIDRHGANLFFQLISRRYERGPIILTSNQSFGAWGEVFGDPVIATAILDRLLHHAVTVNIRGNSYRLKEKLKAGLVRAEEAEA